MLSCRETFDETNPLPSIYIGFLKPNLAVLSPSWKVNSVWNSQAGSFSFQPPANTMGQDISALDFGSRFYSLSKPSFCFWETTWNCSQISRMPQLLSICGCLKQWLPSAAVRAARPLSALLRRQSVRLAVKWRNIFKNNLWYLQYSQLY